MLDSVPEAAALKLTNISYNVSETSENFVFCDNKFVEKRGDDDFMII